MSYRRILPLLIIIFIISACGIISKPSLDSAKKLVREDKVNEAIDMMEELISQDDKNYDLYLSLAKIYLDEKEYHKTNRILEDLSELILDDFDKDDHLLMNTVDDLIDFIIDLKREGQTVDDWFVDFVETTEIMSLNLELSKIIDRVDLPTQADTQKVDREEASVTANKDDVVQAGYDFMSLTYGEVLVMFGPADVEDAGFNTLELIYDNQPYTFMFESKGLSNSTRVGLVSVTGPGGRVFKDLPIIGEDIGIINQKNGFSNYRYYEQTIMNTGNAFVKTNDNDYHYLLFLDDNDQITNCFIHRIDYSQANDYKAEDFLGNTLGGLKNTYGSLYYVDTNENSYIVMYFGMPYYFMFDAKVPLTNDSVVTSVTLESGGSTMYGDPLMTISKEEFMANYQDKYLMIDYEVDFDMAIVEAFGVYAIIIFDSVGFPNQVMVTSDLKEFNLVEDDIFIPEFGFDYLGYTYGELKTFIGLPSNIDDHGPYRYLEYENIPYDFGFSLEDELSDDDFITTVFIYFEEGGAFYNGLTYRDMSYDIFMSKEAQYYSNIIWTEEDQKLEFEDDYAYYYLFYNDDNKPIYMLIETK